MVFLSISISILYFSEQYFIFYDIYKFAATMFMFYFLVHFLYAARYTLRSHQSH